jgi:preprotein translocase subunit Sec63
MADVTQKDVIHALEVLGITLPVTSEDLERARRVQLYTWDPARYANLTNNPKQYMQAYKKAEEMTRKIKAAYTLLTAVLVPDDAADESSQTPG